MTDETNENKQAEMIKLEKVYATTPDRIWELWTTPEGIQSWWAPDGFTVTVEKLDLKPGGELVYTMTATSQPQIEFMQSMGMPLATTSRKTFVELEKDKKLSYNSLVDFVPDKEPYNFLTVVGLEPTDDSKTKVIMEMQPLHDEEWTERLVAGRQNELDNLAKVI